MEGKITKPSYTTGDTPQHLDSRDLIAWAEYHRDTDSITKATSLLDKDEQETLAAIDSLADEGWADWEYGALFIRDNYFEEYAQMFAEDIGAVWDNPWPLSCIDWKQAARELQMDYSSTQYLGKTYWVRRET